MLASRHARHRLARRGSILVAALLIVAPGSVFEAGSAVADDSTGYYLAVSGADLDQNSTYTPQQVDQLARAWGGLVTAGDGAPIQPRSVASGYVLYNPGRVNGTSGKLYIYDSDWGPIQEVYCHNGCTVESKWETQVHLYVNGGTSKSWIITMNARHVSGYSSVSFDYFYGCAINVSGDPDHYCSTGNGADPTASGAMNPGETLHKYFERNRYSNTEYALVGIGVQFHHTHAVNKDRLADVCVTRSSSALCKKTGRGEGGGTHTW
jgi:hypothetical protein